MFYYCNFFPLLKYSDYPETIFSSSIRNHSFLTMRRTGQNWITKSFHGRQQPCTVQVSFTACKSDRHRNHGLTRVKSICAIHTYLIHTQYIMYVAYLTCICLHIQTCYNITTLSNTRCPKIPHKRSPEIVVHGLEQGMQGAQHQILPYLLLSWQKSQGLIGRFDYILYFVDLMI